MSGTGSQTPLQRKNSRCAVLTVLLAVTVGCASTYAALPSRHGSAVHRTLAGASGSLAWEEGCISIHAPGRPPFRMAYRTVRAPRSEWLVVLLHGVLSHCGTWTCVAGDLGQDHDLLLLDYPGCGKSDRPQEKDLGPGGYSPDALARYVFVALEAHLRARRDQPRIALVGHSLGTMVVLRMLGDPGLREEFPHVLSLVERAVLLSPVDFAVEKQHPDFVEIATLPAWQVVVGSLLGRVREKVARSVLQGSRDRDCALREEADRVISVLVDRDTRQAAQAMLRQAVPFTDAGYPDWPRIERLVADYRNVDVPCLLVHGSRDETFGVAMAYKLQAQLPEAWLQVLPECKHALPCDAPEECAALVRTFVDRCGSARPPVTDVLAGLGAPPAEARPLSAVAALP